MFWKQDFSFYISFFSNWPPELAVFLISLIPVAELRVSIPIALGVYNLPVWTAFLWSVTGNILTAAIIIYFINRVYNFFSGRFRWLDKLFTWIFTRTRNRFLHKYEIWGNIALMLFVAVPLPVTGVWTASLAAWLFGLPRLRSLFYISLGAIISAVIVTIISLGIIRIF